MNAYHIHQLLTGDWAIIAPSGSILALYSTLAAAQADLARYSRKVVQS